MIYKCVCGTYVIEPLRLCKECSKHFGNNYKKWPGWIRLRYASLNFGGDYENDLQDVKAEAIGKKGADVKGVNDPVTGGREGKKCPACQTPIKANERLCRTHFNEFGKDPARWPAWLQALVTDNQRIADEGRNHRGGISIDDETFINRHGPANLPGKILPKNKRSESYGRRTYARINRDEISQETLNWHDDYEETEPDQDLPAAIRGDKSGRMYNDRVWHGNQGSGSEFGNLFAERDDLDDKIAAEQEISQWDPRAAAVLLLRFIGHNQTEIAELMNIRQQEVSEILQKAVKHGQ